MTVTCGIDPGTLTLGAAIYRDEQYVWSGILTARGDNNIRRSADLLDQLDALLARWDVQEVACERLPHTEIPAHELYALIGGIGAVVKAAKLGWYLLTPHQWRALIAGVPGNSKKVDVIGMLLLRYHPWGLDRSPDEMEARAIAEAHVIRRKFGIVPAPQEMRRKRRPSTTTHSGMNIDRKSHR